MENALTTTDNNERNIEIIPFGTDERIKLNVSIVQKMIAVPTKTGRIPDATQCMKFMMLCKARHLNPFEGDAYLIGYDTQAGPQFSLITAHQVFLKRAEASRGFDGMESGVVVTSSGELVEREGDLVLPEEILIGGWARVYRKDLSRPFYKKIKLSTFNTGRSRWEKDPAGMIVKCAEADALRTAFPTHLGGLYMQEELPPIDVTSRVSKSASEGISFGPALPTENNSTYVGPSTSPPGIPLSTEGGPIGAPFEDTMPPPKRKRRTKAELEAAKAGQHPREEDEGLDQSTWPGKEKPEAPPRATPLEGLRNLIAASPVDEARLRLHLIKKMALEPHQQFEDLSDEKLIAINSEFMNICSEILDTPKPDTEKAPY